MVAKSDQARSPIRKISLCQLFLLSTRSRSTSSRRSRCCLMVVHNSDCIHPPSQQTFFHDSVDDNGFSLAMGRLHSAANLAACCGTRNWNAVIWGLNLSLHAGMNPKDCSLDADCSYKHLTPWGRLSPPWKCFWLVVKRF